MRTRFLKLPDSVPIPIGKGQAKMFILVNGQNFDGRDILMVLETEINLFLQSSSGAPLGEGRVFHATQFKQNHLLVGQDG